MYLGGHGGDIKSRRLSRSRSLLYLLCLLLLLLCLNSLIIFTPSIPLTWSIFQVSFDFLLFILTNSPATGIFFLTLPWRVCDTSLTLKDGPDLRISTFVTELARLYLRARPWRPGEHGNCDYSALTNQMMQRLGNVNVTTDVVPIYA